MGRLGLWGVCRNAYPPKSIAQASQRPEEDKIMSIGLSPGSSRSSDSEATGTGCQGFCVLVLLLALVVWHLSFVQTIRKILKTHSERC